VLSTTSLVMSPDVDSEKARTSCCSFHHKSDGEVEGPANKRFFEHAFFLSTSLRIEKICLCFADFNMT